MREPFTRLGQKDQPLLLVGAVVALLVLAMPWAIHRSKDLAWTNPIRSSEADALYEKALESGWEAAVAVQTAKDRDEWETIVGQWGDAITLLEKVQTMGAVRSQEAQAKLAEYRTFQKYAAARAENSLPEFSWETVTELAGRVGFILVDPDRNDGLSPGPKLDINADNTITNLSYVNDVLASLGMPPIPGNAITPGPQVQLLSNAYVIKNYPMGELSLHRSHCSDSFTINNKYDCLWKVSLTPK